MTSSPPANGKELALPSDVDADSQLSVVVYDLSQNVQVMMDNMLKKMSEIDQKSAGITEEIEKSKDSVLQRKTHLEQEKDHFEKAAYAVLDMLNGRDIN